MGPAFKGAAGGTFLIDIGTDRVDTFEVTSSVNSLVPSGRSVRSTVIM